MHFQLSTNIPYLYYRNNIKKGVVIMKGIKYTPRKKLQALQLWKDDKMHWRKVCKKMKCTRVSLWRWKKQYDGTLESLKNKSSKPLSDHPTAQTDKEKDAIIKVLAEYPTYSYLEIWKELKEKYGYTSHVFHKL